MTFKMWLDWILTGQPIITHFGRYAELGVDGPEAVYKVGLGYSWIAEKDWENILYNMSSIEESISYSSGEKKMKTRILEKRKMINLHN